MFDIGDTAVPLGEELTLDGIDDDTAVPPDEVSMIGWEEGDTAVPLGEELTEDDIDCDSVEDAGALDVAGSEGT